MIKSHQPSADSLIITVSDPVFEAIWLGCAVLFSAWSVYLYKHYPSAISMAKFQGSVGAAFVAVLGYAAMFERSYFEFDKSSQTLKWSRKRLLGCKSGKLLFRDIRQVVAGRMVGDNKYYPYRRLSILTTTEEILITAFFIPDASRDRVKIADQIRNFISPS